MTHGNLTSFEWLVLSSSAPEGGTRWSAYFSSGLTTSVAMETWPAEHRVFVYEAFVKSGKSVSVTQRLFRRHFNIGHHREVSSRKTILWGYLKSRVYTHKSRTLNNLKEAIRQEIRPIDR